MSSKSVLIVSNIPLTGNLGEFVGRYGYTQFYGPIPTSHITPELIRTIPGVDIFWMSTSSLSDPVHFTNFEAPGYGDRRMWVVGPGLEWTFPTELTSLIGSYLGAQEIQELAEGIPDLGGPMMVSLLRRYRPWWNKLLESYDEKIAGTIGEFMVLHPDPESAYEAMRDYLKIMTGTTYHDYFSEEYARVAGAKGFIDEDLIDEDIDIEIRGAMDLVYPVNWRLLGETLPLEKIRRLLLHLHPGYDDQDATAADFKSPISRYGDIPFDMEIIEPRDEHIYRMALGALDSENPKTEVVLFLTRLLLMKAPEIISLARDKGHTEIEEQLLGIQVHTAKSGTRSLREVLEKRGAK